MPTSFNFPAIDISFGSNAETQFSVNEAVFGDGYTQRSADGLNATRDIWNVLFDRLSETDANTIDAFLKARAGVEAFNWTPPGEASSRQWRCRTYAKEPNGFERYNITATFVEEFDP